MATFHFTMKQAQQADNSYQMSTIADPSSRSSNLYEHAWLPHLYNWVHDTA